MKIVRQTQDRLRTRPAEHHRAPVVAASRQAKTAVESVGGFGQIAARILGLADRVVAAADGALDVGEQDIHPARAAHFASSSAAFGLQHGMRMLSIGQAAETEQTVGENLGIRCKTTPPPRRDGRIVERAASSGVGMPDTGNTPAGRAQSASGGGRRRPDSGIPSASASDTGPGSIWPRCRIAGEIRPPTNRAGTAQD